MVEASRIRNDFKIAPGRKIVIVFSHILYDTLYFFGTDLFRNYAEWWTETVKAACENDKVEWFLKLHPSNVWRGEKKPGEYEEEKLIRQKIGSLPLHVHIISPNTSYNPMSWMQAADVGVTVRGTAGLEMSCMGKPVLTAGDGRYEGRGFTIDSSSPEQYLDRLQSLPAGADFSEARRQLARQFTFALFVRKPFPLHSLRHVLRSGRKPLGRFIDTTFLPTREATGCPINQWPEVKRLEHWLESLKEHDFLIEPDDEPETDAGNGRSDGDAEPKPKFGGLRKEQKKPHAGVHS
jgi:hypothetical protein